MPRPKTGNFNRMSGIPGTRGADPDKVIKAVKPKISESVLSVTLGERLAKRYGPMPNIRGDRVDHESDPA